MSLLGKISIDGQLAVGYMGLEPQQGPVIQLQVQSRTVEVVLDDTRK